MQKKPRKIASGIKSESKGALCKIPFCFKCKRKPVPLFFFFLLQLICSLFAHSTAELFPEEALKQHKSCVLVIATLEGKKMLQCQGNEKTRKHLTYCVILIIQAS